MRVDRYRIQPGVYSTFPPVPSVHPIYKAHGTCVVSSHLHILILAGSAKILTEKSGFYEGAAIDYSLISVYDNAQFIQVAIQKY
jgi:hypothetical protein